MKRMANKKSPGPKIGDQRVVVKFLFLPKCLDGQWRWLELADIIQEYEECSVYRDYAIIKTRWRDVHWCNYLMSPL
jgi:hypothetical protein